MHTNGLGDIPDDDRSPDGFDARYDQFQLELTIVMTDFFMTYLREVYRAFDGDLTAALVLGEVGQENVRRFVSQHARDAIPLQNVSSARSEGGLRGVSALSAAMASGVPRETTRRKLRQLEAKGWIALDEEGMYLATDAARERFCPEFNRMLCQRLLATAGHLRELLGDDAIGRGSDPALAPRPGSIPAASGGGESGDQC